VLEEIVAGLSRDYGVHPYSKWRGAHWRLASLVEIAPDDAVPAARRAAEDVLAWLANPWSPRKFPVIDGRVRRCASQEGRALYACCRIGMADDPRLRMIAHSLVQTQWPDGGWNCDRHRGCTHSSFNETWAPTMGLAAYARDTGHADARAAADRAAEFLLQHSVYQSHRTGAPAHPAFTRLRWPPYWHYDALVGLVTLHRSVGLDDPRTSPALALVESKRRADGSWRSEGKWWRGPGSKGSNVEVVDWGEAAHELLTAQAREVLTAAKRPE
jgi:hypothetical protein